MSNKYYVLNSSEWNFYEDSEKTYHLNRILDRVEQEVRELNPVGIIIPVMTEISIEWLYGEAIKRLYDWCEENDKYIYVLSSAYPYDYPLHNFKNIIWKKFDGYDIINFATIENYYKDKKPILMYPSKLFTCYNNKPHAHRDYIVDQLVYHRLIKQGIVTYNWHVEGRDFKHYTGDPVLKDEVNFKLHETHSPNDVPWRYLSGLIDIVTESSYEHNEFFLTEKTARPLMTQKPFLVAGPQGYHKYLESKGIKLYDEIFDYSFDDEPTLEKRMDGLLENLLRLREQYKTVADYKELLSIVKPKLEYNLNAYLKHVAMGDGFNDNPFPWLFEEDISNYVEMQTPNGGSEFNMLHNFMHTVVAKYRAGEYTLPDTHYIPESFYIVDFQHTVKFPELWKDHPMRPIDFSFPKSHKFNEYNCQIHPHSEDEMRMISCIADDIEKVNPDKVLIFSGSEMDVDLIYGELYHMLADWCRTQNKKIHIFVTAIPIGMYPPEYVELHKFVQTYDVANLTEARDYHGCVGSTTREIVRKPPKLFTCYNSRLADYRKYIIDQLAKYDLLENSVTTYKLSYGKMHPDEWLYYNGTPVLIDEEDYPNCDPKYHGWPKSYTQGCIDIVTETRIDPLTWYMSEKTARPLITLRPFLVLSSPGYHTWLEHKGIQKYDEIFDYSFDDKEDYKERADGIVKNIINLSKKYKTPEDYESLLEMLRPKLKQNLINYIDHVQTGQSTLPHLPDWLDYTRLAEIAGGNVRKCGEYPTHHHGTLGHPIHGEVMPIIHLLGRLDDLREECNNDWKTEVDQMGHSLYQYILNL